MPRNFHFQESNKYLPIYHSILSFKAYLSEQKSRICFMQIQKEFDPIVHLRRSYQISNANSARIRM